MSASAALADVAESLHVALIGSPNSGKTTLFNALTGARARVGNYPGVTVERREGEVRDVQRPILLLDLPGTYSLNPETPDEEIVREVLAGECPDEPIPDALVVVVDGTTYQVTRDGVSAAPDEAPVPFAVLTHFLPEKTTDFATIVSFDDLIGRLDALRNTDNQFFAVRIEGNFDYVKTRAVCKSDGSASLVDAALTQAEFEFRDVEGVLVGFWTPEYAKSVNVVGWHLHFLTADRSGGGHLLACQGAGLRAQVQHLSDFRMAIPETVAFLKADLTRDTSGDLDKAEKDH